MKTYLPIIKEWRDAGKKVVIARVIKTWNASPRPIGSVLVISETLEMAGSVSGGCVEGAVLKAAKKIFEDGQAQLLDFGVSNDEAWTVGLTCGGRIQVLAEPLAEEDDPIWSAVKRGVEENEGGIWISSLKGNTSSSNWLNAEGDALNNIDTNLKEAALN